MITILIFFLLGGIYGYINSKDWFLTFGFAFLGIPIALIVGLALPAKYADVIIEEGQLMTLQDNMTISGRFYIGSGVLDGSAMYSFYTRNPDGSFSLRTIPAKNSKIYLKDAAPTFQRHEFKLTDAWVNYFSTSSEHPAGYYVFRVPEGSILQTQNLDAK